MIRVGDFEITRIEEIRLEEASSLFADWRPEMAAAHPWMDRAYYNPNEDTFVSSIHSWLLRTPSHTILIDSCGGNGKLRPASPRFDHLDQPYLERLAQAGVQPADVDMLVNTHLHVDHVGWNTRWDGDGWVPTFPNATYFVPRIERDLRDPASGAAMRSPETQLPFKDSVQPLLDGARVVLLDGGETLAEGVDLVPIPGHAPGQLAVRARSGGEEALFIADVMHQPIQVFHPGWNSRYCEDQPLARATRLKVLEYCADRGCLVLPGHFGAPHCGRVRRSGTGYSFEPSVERP